MRRWAQAVIDDLHLNGDETVLDAGGGFRAQCGGGANIARLMAATQAVEKREPYSRYLGVAEFRKYRTAENATAAMERAGWTDVRAEVFDSPVRFENLDKAALYLRTIILQRHVAAWLTGHSSRSSRPATAGPAAATAGPFPPAMWASTRGRGSWRGWPMPEFPAITVRS